MLKTITSQAAIVLIGFVALTFYSLGKRTEELTTSVHSCISEEAKRAHGEPTSDDIVGCVHKKGFTPHDAEFGSHQCRNGYLMFKGDDRMLYKSDTIESCWNIKSFFSPFFSLQHSSTAANDTCSSVRVFFNSR